MSLTWLWDDEQWGLGLISLLLDQEDQQTSSQEDRHAVAPYPRIAVHCEPPRLTLLQILSLTPELRFQLNILDRGNLGQAKIAGMTTDLRLVGVDYNNIILVQYIGYIFTQFPAGFIMGKYKPALLLSICCVVWGVIAGASGFAQNVGGMMGVRFLVGVAEAPL